jgi:aminobenzoyl-glutamate utilization protein B
MRILSAFLVGAVVVTASLDAQQLPQAPAATSSPQLDQYKRNVGLEVDALQENIQKWNDSVFSFGELGFQEFETTKYLTAILKQNGFTIQEGRRRHPDGVDRAMGIGQAGDCARLGCRLHPASLAEAGRRLARTDHRGRARPREGHNSGMPLQIAAALAVKGDGAAASARHADAVAGHRGRTGRHKAYYMRAGSSKTSTSRSSRTSVKTSV